MKTTQNSMTLSVLTVAVRSALLVMAAMPLSAMADDAATAADQTTPTNTVDFGVNGTSKSSDKFGEYNGLNKSGVIVNGDISLKGGNAYGQGTGTNYWSITGTDLGTTSRDIGGTVGNQGKWSLGVDFDELQHNIDDNYQTPYNGTMGGNLFTLPSTFGVINAKRPSPATNPDGTPKMYGADALTTNQLAAFHSENVYSKRDTTSVKAGVNLDQQWSLTFDYKHIDQSGAKLIGSGTDNLVDSVGTWGNEKVAILMNPTNSQTDNITLALNWKGDQGFASIGYYGSLYHDDYDGLSWSNPWISSTTPTAGTNPGEAFQIDSMSTPPSNQFHQLNASGGYHISPTTQLVGGLSYARNTQNESYAGTYTPDMLNAALPANSLDASVIMKHADLKLTNQTTKDLNLAAGLTYNERDNHTGSNMYQYSVLGGAPISPINVPESWKHTQGDLSASYRIASNQHLHAAYDYDEMQRWCDTDGSGLYAVGAVGTTGSVTPADGGAYGTANSCAQVPKQTTNSLALDYRLSASDTVNFKAGYAYSKRDSDVNAFFYNPLHSFSEGYEDMGFLAFFQASRNENAVKMGADWQATDKLDLSLNGKYAKDDYGVTYGVQQGEQYSVDLDANYSISEGNSFDAFVTNQHRTRDMTNGNGRLADSLATAFFTNNLTDDQLMLGVGAKQKGLMAGKLQLSESVTYSLDKTDYSTAVGGTGSGSTCSTTTSNGITSTNCGSFPTLKTEDIILKLTGTYQVSKPAKLILSYQFEHLNVSDPQYYTGYQLGFVNGSGILPSFQVAPSYNISEVFLAYSYSFK